MMSGVLRDDDIADDVTPVRSGDFCGPDVGNLRVGVGG